MPGVPSGRGCEACRKQKKKCDQIQPTCSRCARLKIPCIGSGQQRYKFKSETVASARLAKNGYKGFLAAPPSNQITFVTSAFVSTFEVKDLRYDISCYGGFLRDIPRRLGQNDALDASVDALTSAFSSLYTKEQSRDTLGKYVYALKTLRVYLGDPIKAREPNTLCAIYLIMICQGWIGKPNDQYTSHGEIMAHLLGDAVQQDWHGDFEVEMLFTLCVPVIFESVANPNIKVNAWFTKLIESIGPQFGPKRQVEDPRASPIESLRLGTLARIPDFVRDPVFYLLDIRTMYDQMVTDCETIRGFLTQMKESHPSTASRSLAFTKTYTSYQGGHGLLLGLSLILNSILRIFDPYDIRLVEEAANFSIDTMVLAEDAARYRPIGSSYMPICLSAAWVATDGTTQQMDIQRLLIEWGNDFTKSDGMAMAFWIKHRLDRLRMSLFSPPQQLMDHPSINGSSEEEFLESLLSGDASGNGYVKGPTSEPPSYSVSSCTIL